MLIPILQSLFECKNLDQERIWAQDPLLDLNQTHIFFSKKNLHFPNNTILIRFTFSSSKFFALKL